MTFCPKCGSRHDPALSDCPTPPNALLAAPSAAVVGAVETAAAIPVKLTGLAHARRLPRLCAGAIDLGIVIAVFAIGGLLAAWMNPVVRVGWLLTLLSLVPAGYLLLRDSIAGQSVGKWVMDLVVVDRELAQPGGPIESILRNWPMAVGPLLWVGASMFPPLILAGAVVLAVACVSIGLQVLAGADAWPGDWMADTRVMHERDATRLVASAQAIRSSSKAAVAGGVLSLATVVVGVLLWLRGRRPTVKRGGEAAGRRED